MKKLLIYILIHIAVSHSFAQMNSRNGESFAPSKTYRILVVFADVIDDEVSYSFPNWPEGQLPQYVNNLFDNDENFGLSRYVSRFFDEASFGQMKVIADYYPRLVRITRSDILQYTGLPSKLRGMTR